jgi:hypothetical protein
MASRFWVGGTGTWDSSSTTHWSATSGGSSGASVPTSTDDVTFDASSGGGTVTLNFGGPITVLSITMGAFTGTWDNSVNNNNITVTNTGNAFNGSGTGTRTIKLGTATYTLSGNTNATWQFLTATNLTYTGNTGCTIAFTGTGNGTRKIDSSTAGLSHGNVTVATSSSGKFQVNGGNVANITLNSLSFTGGGACRVEFPASAAVTITNSVAWAGSSTGQLFLGTFSQSSSCTVNLAGGSTVSWAGVQDLTFTGSPTITNSFDLGGNSGATISKPAAAGSGAGVIGS